MLYNWLSARQKLKLGHRSGRLGKKSRSLFFPSGRLASLPAECSSRVSCKAQMSCWCLCKLDSPHLIGRWDRWTQSGRHWRESGKRLGSAVLQHLSPPTPPWSAQVCSTPSTCCLWKDPLHIRPPPSHQQISHQGWKELYQNKNFVDRHLSRNVAISKMSPPKRNSSSRMWVINSWTVLAASMLLLSIWKALSSFPVYTFQW